MKSARYIWLLFVLCTNIALGQVRFTASASKTTVGTGEPFEISFSLNADGQGFTPPSFDGFQVVSGPNQSMSQSIINGASSVSNAISYELVPVKIGDYTIGPASIVINGKRYTTQPVHIKVVKGAPVRQNAQPQGNPGFGSGEAISPPADGNIAKSVFVRAEADRSAPYQGQQVILTYRLYTRMGIAGIQIDKAPDFNGFWNEQIKQPSQQPTVHIETYKGQRYKVADIYKVILFPDHAGDIKIDPMQMTMQVQQPVHSDDFFDQFFNDVREVPFQTKSNAVTVHVKPLPAAPNGFSDAVGKFTIETTIDKKELKANEPLNYKVKISGAGNIKLMKAPAPPFPADFEKYDPKVTDSTTVNEHGVTGYRIYSYLLIPRHQGEYTIDPLKFAYFNPTAGRYETVDAQGFHIKVNKGIVENNVTAYGDQEDVKQLGKDIRYIKSDAGNLTRDGEQFFGSVGYWVLLLIGPLLFAGAWYYRKWNARYNSDIVAVKSRRAGKMAAKHLAIAQKQLAAGNAKTFYEAVFRGLYGYLSDKLNIPAADLNKENIAAGLRARNVEETLITELTNTLDLCEMARYAPVSDIAQQEVFEKAKGIINDIESRL